MAQFVTTENNVLRAAASLAANGTATSNLNLTGGPLSATLVVSSTPGATVTANAGITINILVSGDGGSTYSTVPAYSTFIPSVASTLASVAIELPGGKRYQVQYVNTDGSNAITLVGSVYSVVVSLG